MNFPPILLFRIVLTSMTVLCTLVIGRAADAGPPDWWASSGILNAGAPQDDYAVANAGQVKNFALKAKEQFDARWPGGAGIIIDQMVASWAVPKAGRDDYAAANLLQVKTVVAGFYDRLAEMGTGGTDIYPWTANAARADDSLVANIGQLKSAFSFPIPNDLDNDGIPNMWEFQRGLNWSDGQDGGYNGPMWPMPQPPAVPVLPNPEWFYFPDNLGNLVWSQTAYEAAMEAYALAVEEYPALLADYHAALTIWQADMLRQDPDGDGLSNVTEYLVGSDPHLADTDGDTFADGVEVTHGSLPGLASSTPPFRLEVLSGNLQEVITGTTSAPVALRASRAGVPLVGKAVQVSSTQASLLLVPAGGGNAAAAQTLTTNAQGQVVVSMQAPPSPALGLVQVLAELTEHAGVVTGFQAAVVEPGLSFLRPDVWDWLSKGGQIDGSSGSSGGGLSGGSSGSGSSGSGSNGGSSGSGSSMMNFVAGQQAVILSRESSVGGGSYSPGTPDTTEPGPPEPNGPPVERHDQPDLDEYNNTAGVTLYFSVQEVQTGTNASGEPVFQKRYSWKKQRMKPGPPIIVPGSPAYATAYVARNEKYANGHQVIETAAQVEAKAPNPTYSGNISGHLTFDSLSTADQQTKGTAGKKLEARAENGNYDQVGWRQLWLFTGVPAKEDITQTFMVKTTTGIGEEAEEAYGTFTLTVKKDQAVSTEGAVEGEEEIPGVSISNGVASIQPAVPGGNGDVVKIDLLPVDLEVDSNNDGTIDGADTAVEDVESGGSIDKMGHHLQVNTFDYDADKVPDYIDGITKGGSPLASAGGNSIAGDPQRHFSKLKMTLGLSRSEYEFMFEYSADNPSNMSVSQGSNFGQKEQVGGAVENYNISAPGGSLRIWTKDAGTSRKAESITASTAGDFVPANEWIAGDKMPTGDMFLEGVRPSTGWGSDKIKLKARSKTSTGTVIDLDTVSLTVSKSVLRVYVNRPYTYEAAATVKRPQLVIDYSTPRNANTSLFNAMHPDRHDPVALPDARGSYNWYGHGFWCASYAGPGDATIMTANETGPDGSKEYWSGKSSGSGGGSVESARRTHLKEGKVFWFAEPGVEHGKRPEAETYQTATSPPIRTPHGEDMKIVAWHDFILPPKLLQKICTYPGRHDFTKYGLDIGATEGGCATYVGLTLKDAGMSEHLQWEVRQHLTASHGVANLFPVVQIPGWDWFWAWSEEAVITLARDNFIATPGTDTWGGYTPAWQLNFYDPGLLAKWMDELRRTKKRTSTIYIKMPATP